MGDSDTAAIREVLPPGLLAEAIGAAGNVGPPFRIVKPLTALEQSDIAIVEVDVDGRAQPIFFKHVSLPALRARWPYPKSDARWLVNVRSYENEAAFYARLLADEGLRALLARGGLFIPRPLAVRLPSRETPPLQRRYNLLLQAIDRTAWMEHDELGREDAEVALRALAAFHAANWAPADASCVGGREGAAGAGAGADDAPVFEHGGWWRPAIRPDLRAWRLPAVYERLAEHFPRDFAGHDKDAMAAALAALAAPAARRWLSAQVAARASGAPGTTLLHGDAKTSNVFFPVPSAVAASAAASAPPAPAPRLHQRACLIDFQWTAPAQTGMGDVAYLLAGAVKPDALLGVAGGSTADGSGVDAQSVGGAGAAAAAPTAPATAAAGGPEEPLLALYCEAFAAEMRAQHGAAAERDASLGAALAASCDGGYLRRQFSLELATYVSTALPQLMAGVTPDVAEENKRKYGYLTHERHGAVMAWMCARAAGAARALLPAEMRP